MPTPKDYLYIVGQHWLVRKVSEKELPACAMAVSDWESLSIKILDTISPALFEEVLIHEMLELVVMDLQIVENIRSSVRQPHELADHIAECLDSHVAALIRENQQWFPIIRGEIEVRGENGDSVSEGAVEKRRQTPFPT